MGESNSRRFTDVGARQTPPIQPWLWKPHVQVRSAARGNSTRAVAVSPRAAVAHADISVPGFALSARPPPPPPPSSRSAPLQVRGPARELRALPESRPQVRVRLVQRRGQVHPAAALRRGARPALAGLVQQERQVLQPAHHRGKDARRRPLLLLPKWICASLPLVRKICRRPPAAEEQGIKCSATFCGINVRIRRHVARVRLPLAGMQPAVG